MAALLNVRLFKAHKNSWLVIQNEMRARWGGRCGDLDSRGLHSALCSL